MQPLAMQPLYTAISCRSAYQLNWSVTLFGAVDLPLQSGWLNKLRAVTEPDGVRILECRLAQPNVLQFFVSTIPSVCPSEIIRSVKGRWQHLHKWQIPKAFHRNYHVQSVGSAKCQTLDVYIAGQNQKHLMGDLRVQAQLEAVQFHDPSIDLAAKRLGNYGQFVYSMQIVVETAQGWNEIRSEVLTATRDMIIGSAAKKKWLLSRIGLLSNHIHILLGANMTESPESVVLSLLNNLAWVQGMKPVYKFSYYVGTFGGYDRSVVWK